MALLKKITQKDGVVTNYHRILYIQNTINRQTSIAVASYTTEECRIEEEKGNIEYPYMQATTYETEYDPDMDAKKAYEYLQTLEDFEGAESI